ncbi:3,4-dihydroxy-2-butanone-4-phosphate synthase [Rhodococcus koreensis]|uniref:3,4-dihydroxy-2-butanone-4-phosphate synthase n=1 Tax=Rhodococcus koreensis TaxID=99653 RepID=UPI003672BE90
MALQTDRALRNAGFNDGLITRALTALKAGDPIVVVDAEDRENEGDLIVAAERITTGTMAFLVRHTSGFVCVAMPGEECDRLDLPPMCSRTQDHFGTAYTVTVDAANGVTTGISAADRAHTARVLADPQTKPSDLTRPGHVVPLRASSGGVLARPGHTEAAVDLARLAGLRPAGVLAEIVSTRNPHQMARRPELEDFAAKHGLAMVSIADLATYRRRTEARVVRLAAANLPTEHGGFRIHGYRSLPDGAEHIVLQCGDLDDAAEPVPVHIETECMLGHIFGSQVCQCGRQLAKVMDEIAALGRGLVLYLRPPNPTQDGRTPLIGQLTRNGRCAISDDTEASELLTDVTARILDDLGIENAALIPSEADTDAVHLGGRGCTLQDEGKTP